MITSVSLGSYAKLLIERRRGGSNSRACVSRSTDLKSDAISHSATSPMIGRAKVEKTKYGPTNPYSKGAGKACRLTAPIAVCIITRVVHGDNSYRLKTLEGEQMSKPVSVLDVAQYILERLGSMTTWKLQKLCYYSQAWSLVWDDEPLFTERIEAWANGPVIPALYEKHKGQFSISRVQGEPTKLSDSQRETVDAVLGTYGYKTPVWLSELTHSEEPWQRARHRDRLGPGERGNSKISLGDMAEYYGGLVAS